MNWWYVLAWWVFWFTYIMMAGPDTELPKPKLLVGFIVFLASGVVGPVGCFIRLTK